MPVIAYPSNSTENILSLLNKYAQLRSVIRAERELFLTLHESYRAVLQSLEEQHSAPINYKMLSEANDKGEELSKLSENIKTTVQKASTFRTELASVLPVATEDFLRRGNQVLFGGTGVGADSFLLAYSIDSDTAEYIVERVNYGQEATAVLNDKDRMKTVKELINEKTLAAYLSFF